MPARHAEYGDNQLVRNVVIAIVLIILFHGWRHSEFLDTKKTGQAGVIGDLVFIIAFWVNGQFPLMGAADYHTEIARKVQQGTGAMGCDQLGATD